MDDTTINSVIWPGWETVRMIGQGSFGKVYEIARGISGYRERCALKVITIPKEKSEITNLRSEGYNDESITATFRSYLDSFLGEYALMSRLNGNANIVNCHDVQYIQHDDGFGWDIFIRMELLTPFTSAFAGEIAEKTVLDCARDMCRALIHCERINIIHRDIKPQNIFVSDNGDFKLGDFGVAKVVEGPNIGSVAGTYRYMAPEVARGETYGTTADIYSLGLTLYWMLNKRRLPFFPLPPAVLYARADEDARGRRFSGEPIPSPLYGSESLKRIILKACAFDPKDRYQSAKDMLEDIERIGRHGPEIDREKQYNNALALKKEEEFTAAAKLFEQLGEYRDSKEQAAGCQNLAGLSAGYSEAKAAMDAAESYSEWLAAAKLFESISGWKDADQLKDRCLNEAERLRRRKNAGILCAAGAAMILLIIAVCFLFTKPGPDPSSSAAVSSDGSSDAPDTTHVHSWGKWMVETEPGCETAGSEVRTCIDDPDHKEWREIEALGHDWAEATTEVPKTCRRCGATEGEPLKKGPGEEDLKGYTDITVPSNSWLPDYETKYVKTKYGNAAYLRIAPDDSSKSRSKLVNEGEKVTVLARENGFSLVKTNDGRIGWVKSELLVDRYG